MTIGPAEKADAAAIAALRTDVARELTQRFGRGHWSRVTTRTEVMRQLRATRMLVARCGGAVVGTVRLLRANPALFDASAFTPATTALYVIGLAVAPEARGRGTGAALMAAAKDMARDWPAQALWLDTYAGEAGAGPFYERQGFRFVGPSSFKDAPLHFYEWRVTASAGQSPTLVSSRT